MYFIFFCIQQSTQTKSHSNFFLFNDIDTQKDLTVIELHTHFNQNYDELKLKTKKKITVKFKL